MTDKMASRGPALLQAAARGAAAGMLGVVVMTAGEKLEQSLTHRPNSYIPARTLLTLLGRHPTDADRPLVWNHVMHYGTGAVLGALRGVWAAVGLRGPEAHLAHTMVRLSTDQTLENTTGVGSPPMKWSRQEHAIDVLHKTVYSITTGLIAERLIPSSLESRRGLTSH